MKDPIDLKSDDHKSLLEQCIPNLQRIVPRTICGPVSIHNKGAFDWGWQGFLAYGAQTTVIVIDPVTLQCAQTFSKHRSYVIKICWKKTKHYHQLSSPYCLTLANADSTGIIYVWDVSSGEVLTTLQDGSKPILDLEWLGYSDGSDHLLAAIHPPYGYVIWDTRHGTKIWKKTYTEVILSIHFDPFHFNKVAFLCQGCILFIDDFNLNKCPSSNGQRFYVSSPRVSPGRNANSIDDKENAGTLLKRKMKEFVVGDVKPKDDSNHINECLHMTYHKTIHDIILLIYQKEILILDLNIKLTLGIIALDRNMSPFCQISLSWQQDVIFCLHESGTVSCYFRRHVISSSDYHNEESSWNIDSSNHFFEVMYERKCCSEPLRLTKQSKAVGFVLDPVSETKIALLLGDGKVIFKELVSSNLNNQQFCNPEAFHEANSLPLKTSFFTSKNYFDNDNTDFKVFKKVPRISLASILPACSFLEKKCNYLNVRVLMTGMIPSMTSPPFILRMCPPLTTRNLSHYTPVLAIGTNIGSVQIFNIATGLLEREFSLHTYPVRGVEWTSLNSILSFGHQPLTSNQGLVRNELMHTDISTGITIPLRTYKGEESSIDMIRVSYLKQYFIVVFKDDPFELWDARRLVALRTMPKKFPRVTALEWSPTSHMKLMRKESESADTEEKKLKDENSLGTPTQSEFVPEKPAVAKESFLFTDPDGHLYHFSVEGNVIKDGTKIPPDSQMSTITSIAWKSYEIVLSDTNGSLTVWNLKTKRFRHISTHRGWIRKVRFAPGRDNLKVIVLFADGVDIWDIREMTLLSQLKYPKDCCKIIDMEWGASDKPILALIDGSVKIMDVTLKLCNSSIASYEVKDSLASPYLFDQEVSLNLKTLLIHQPWKAKYCLNFLSSDGFNEEQLKGINIWLSRIPSDVKEFLENCDSTSLRAEVVAYLFGDQGDVDFWNVASYYLFYISSLSKQTSSVSDKCANLVDLNDIDITEDISLGLFEQNDILINHLSTSYGYICDHRKYRHHEIERLGVYESKNLEGSLRTMLCQQLAIIGEKDRAVHLLLDTDPSNDRYYDDCLRACLLSATHHSTQAQSTIKLVATNLIAAGKIWEGVELLCLIGKAGDACRYLQSYGHWESSVWLAKCVLPLSEAGDILKKWAQQLISVNYKDLGVGVYLSTGAFSLAVEQLANQYYHQRAALLLFAILQRQLNANYSLPLETSSSDSWNSTALKKLIENVQRKYILYVYGLGNHAAVSYYCQQLGEIGSDIKKELESMK